VNLRKVHYDIALEAFAKKYNVTKSQASQIIGNLFDHVIHEAEDGNHSDCTQQHPPIHQVLQAQRSCGQANAGADR
jgi:hypothetical protein